MSITLNNFRARQVHNGWVIEANAPAGYIGREYVFASLADIAEWLKVQVEAPPDRSSDQPK